MKRFVDYIMKYKFYVVIAAVGLLYILFESNYDGSWGNLQRTSIKYNHHSHKVAELTMTDVQVDTSDFGVAKYEKFFEKDQRSDAQATFNYIISQIGEFHIGESIKPKFLKSKERFLVCYGDEMSIIVSYERVGRTSFGPPFYTVCIEYADPDCYDWEYLTWRINND